MNLSCVLAHARPLVWSRVIVLLALLAPATASAQILVVAPHPDDDVIMAAGVIHRAVQRGQVVHVVFVTNGDIDSVAGGLLRQSEAVSAQLQLGVPESNLIFLGYPDGSMRVVRQYTAPDVAFTAPTGRSTTYGNRGLGGVDYHTYRHGTAGLYNWPTVVGDLADAIGWLRPSHILTTADWDGHADHATTSALVREAVQRVTASDAGYNPTIHRTGIWLVDPTSPSPTWPSPINPAAYFTEWTISVPAVWAERESLDVPVGMQSPYYATNAKYNAIASHVSQEGVQGFLGRWVHKDEIFWSEQAAGSNHPPVPAAGADQEAYEGDTVTLDGSASWDRDADAITYQWRQVTGPSVSVLNSTSQRPTFIAPTGLSQDADLSFELVVSDGSVTSLPDAVRVRVRSSVPPPAYGANVASAAAFTASSQAPGQGAEKVADGVISGYPADATREWATLREGAGAWIQLNWSTPVEVAKVVLYDRPNADDHVRAGTLQFSDGSTVSVGALNNDATPVEIAFPARVAGWVRFTIGQVSPETSSVGLAELQVFGLREPAMISLSGDLAFGRVAPGTTSARTLRISNSGPATLTVTSITYPPGFSGPWSGSIAAGGFQDVAVTFAPMALVAYGGTVRVLADHTSGRNTIAVSGAGRPRLAHPSDFDGDGATDLAVFRPSTGTWYARDQFVAQWGEVGGIPVPGDYNGDGTADVAVFRPSTGTWYVRGQFVAQWGEAGDIPVPGDYNGDGTADVAVFRPSTGTWYVRVQFVAQWGEAGDIPVPGDYNGDGTADVAVFRPSTGTWYVRGQFAAEWGEAGDVPVPSDYNGDGITEVAVFRPSTGTWYVRGQFAARWGEPGDSPVPGDYNGDGTADVAVFRPSNGTWYVRGQFTAQWGAAGDIPVPGDYNGDGAVDVAVFRPASGVWYVRGQFTVQWGEAGDIPVPGDYNGDGTTDVAVFRPASGVWYVRDQFTADWGEAGDIPVSGDYDGDGTADVAVFRPSTGTWYVRGQFTADWGEAGDIPVPVDYNGDGTADLAVFRPSNGTWYVRGQFTVQWGEAGDIPAPRDFDGDGYSDIAVYRCSTGTWYVRNQFAVTWGGSPDLPGWRPVSYPGP